MDRVSVYRDAEDKWRWRRQSENGKIVSTSGEGYESREHALKMAGDLNPETVVDVKG
jgi:uncharacterized protein YegP (UPF0339 family)